MRAPWLLSLLLWITLGTCVIVALLTVIGALFPSIVAHSRGAAQTRPRLALAVGLVNGGLLIALAIALRVLARQTDLRPAQVALPVLWILGLGLAMGWAAVSGLIGERLWPERSVHAQRALGAGAAILASLAPVVGWFAILPYVSALGLGGFILALLGRSELPE